MSARTGSSDYAASLGITRSASRRNRWLRAPATNFTKPRKRLRARPQRQHRRQRAPNLHPQRCLRVGRTGDQADLVESVLERRHLRPVRRDSSPRFGSSRGQAPPQRTARLPESARGLPTARGRPAEPQTRRRPRSRFRRGKVARPICGAKPNGERLDHDPLASAPAGKHGFCSYVRCFPVGSVEASFSRGRPHGPGSPAGDLARSASDSHEGQHAQGAA